MSTAGAKPRVPGDQCKLITAVFVDDGTDLALLKALRSDKGIIRASSTSCLGSSITAEARTKPGKLPEPLMVRKVEILVPEDRADELFDFVCEHARITEPGRGVVWQTSAPFCTPYELPPGLPEEHD